MTEEINTSYQEKENAGCLGIGFSVLMPLVGIILYFVKKDSVNNPSSYLYGALAGFFIGVLLRLIAASAGA